MAISSRKLVAKSEENSRAQEKILDDAQEQRSRISHRQLKLRAQLVQAQLVVANHQVASQGENGVATLPQELRDMLERRKADRKQMQVSLSSLDELIGQTTLDVDRLRGELQSVELTIKKERAEDPENQRLASDAARTASTLAGAKARMQEIMDECERKLPAFSADPLFSYLKSSSAKEDRSKLVRHFDSMLASASGFKDNAERHSLLLAMKRECSSIDDDAQQAHDTAVGILNDSLAKQARRHGLDAAKERFEEARRKLTASKEKAKTIHADLDDMAHEKDALYLQVCEKLSSMMASLDVSELQRLASATTNKQDDEAVAQILGIESELSTIEAQLRAVTRTEEQAKEKLDRAKKLERKLRESRYSSSEVEYNSRLDLDSLLLGYMVGSIDVDAFTRDVLRSQEQVYVPPPYTPSSSSSSSSSGWGSSSSSSSDSGSWSSSSSSDSGSFSTSDSF